MKVIGIIGMGRMGQTIASLLDTRTDLAYHTFQRITPENSALISTCDVAIEFTVPEAAPAVIRHCITHGIPVVSGTTGWYEYHLDSILTHCRENNGTFLYATNFSIGMNIVFALNRKLAMVMNKFPAYKPAVKEIHHIHKKDMPSGTAFTMLEDLISRHSGYQGFVLNPELKDVLSNHVLVTAEREGEIKGIHEVIWNSGKEQISIRHEAFDRVIFAEGAIMAAQWLMQHKQGIYTMQDIIHI